MTEAVVVALIMTLPPTILGVLNLFRTREVHKVVNSSATGLKEANERALTAKDS